MAQLTIQRVLQTHTELEFAVLVGSRADGRAQPESDWDIAIQWKREISMLDNLANTETLRRNLAAALGVAEDRVDLIDLPRAGLAMRALVAEEGIPLIGEDNLAWNHFLGRLWRELEVYEWEKQHAA
jgi:predicted nucleotidyltransferase